MSKATTDEIDRLAQIVADYHLMHHTLAKSDCILVLGSYDLRVAERGAELFLAGWAPWLLFSGNVGAITNGLFDKPEAERFAEIALARGVPADRILIENRSTNTGANIRFSRELLAEQGINAESFILVQKPYMERRTYATFQQLWPGPRVLVTSPQISWEEYATPAVPKDRMISIMLGDLQRIKLYPARGFQIPQEIPAEVWAAFEQLVALGYDQHLVAE